MDEKEREAAKAAFIQGLSDRDNLTENFLTGADYGFDAGVAAAQSSGPTRKCDWCEHQTPTVGDWCVMCGRFCDTGHQSSGPGPRQALGGDVMTANLTRDWPQELTAWGHPLNFIPKLIESADILLHRHDFDGHGWEEHEYAYRAAKRFMDEYRPAQTETTVLRQALANLVEAAEKQDAKLRVAFGNAHGWRITDELLAARALLGETGGKQ